MKDFHFKQFSIAQNKDVFRVGTDAVLLGALSSLGNSENILEVGSGSGIISLMLAQRNQSADILAIDIDENAVKLSEINFKNSPFSERLNSKNIDIKELPSKKKI